MSSLSSVSSCLLLVACLAVDLLLVGCRCEKTTGPFEDKLVAQAHTCSKSLTCEIRISDVSDFRWDTGYALYNGTKDERSSLLGTEDVGFVEGERQIVFLTKGKVVFQESEPTEPETGTPGSVMFECPDASGVQYLIFHPDTVFVVRPQVGEKGPYLLLHPL